MNAQALTTGDRPLVVDEFTIEHGKMPNHYIARLAIRYQREEYAKALTVAQAFLNTRFRHVVVTGHSGSPNGDQISLFFWAAGRQDGAQ